MRMSTLSDGRCCLLLDARRCGHFEPPPAAVLRKTGYRESDWKTTGRCVIHRLQGPPATTRSIQADVTTKIGKVTVRGGIPSQARIVVPPWLWGGEPDVFFARANLRVRRDAASSAVLVQTDERYLHAKPQLVESRYVAGPSRRRPDFDLLARLSERNAVDSAGPNAVTRAQLADVTRRAEETEDLVDRFYLWQLQTMVAGKDEVASTVADIHKALGTLESSSSPGLTPFRDASVHLVRRSETLVHRTKLISVLLRIEHDELLRGGNVAGLKAQSAAGDLVFASGDGLLSGLALFDAYLGPLLGALTPGVWGLSAHRASGTVLYSLGRTVSGTRQGSAEMLQLLPSHSPAVQTWQSPQVGHQAYAEAITWWAEQLNKIFGVLTNPAVFADRAGSYSPMKHQQALMTMEQLFRRVSSIQTSHRDGHARRVLLFSVLDTLERLTGRAIETHCLSSYANKTLDRVRSLLPPLAAPVLLPAAERAVTALEEVQHGFFIKPSTQRSAAASHSVAGLPLPEAAARYIKVLRDATHGHGSNKTANAPTTNILLAQHNGEIAHDLPLIGYLYLLDVMTRPDDLYPILYRNGNV